MQIIDSQIHVWGSGLPNNAAHIPVTSFGYDTALSMMHEAAVDAAVIHPPSWDPGATELALRAVERHPDRFAIMGDLDLDDPGSKDRLVTWRDQPGVLGLRYLFLDDQAGRLTDGSLDWLWAGAEQNGIPIAMLATGSEAAIARIAERYPDLRLTIDHLGGRGGNTTLKDAEAMMHIPDLLALAQYPNIAVKATGLPGYSAEPYPYPIMLGNLRQVTDAFGPERVFWGTDITKMKCTWTECITMFTEHTPWLDDNARRLIMGEAVCRWWGWERS